MQLKQKNDEVQTKFESLTIYGWVSKLTQIQYKELLPNHT